MIEDRLLEPVADRIENRAEAVARRLDEDEELVYSAQYVRVLLRILRLYWAGLVFIGFLFGLALGITVVGVALFGK
jgi:hypothetical protein